MESKINYSEKYSNMSKSILHSRINFDYSLFLFCLPQAHWAIFVFSRPPQWKLQVWRLVDFLSLFFLNSHSVQNEFTRLHNMLINIICVVNHAWALSLSTGICLCLCKFLSICVAFHWILLLKISSLFMRYMVGSHLCIQLFLYSNQMLFAHKKLSHWSGYSWM